MTLTTAAEPAKILLRLPRAMHAQLKTTAAAEGVSLNTLLATLIAGSIGWQLEPQNQVRPAAVASPGPRDRDLQEGPDGRGS